LREYNGFADLCLLRHIPSKLRLIQLTQFALSSERLEKADRRHIKSKTHVALNGMLIYYLNSCAEESCEGLIECWEYYLRVNWTNNLA